VKTGGGYFQFRQLSATTANGSGGGSPRLVKVEEFLGANSVAVDNFNVLTQAYFPAVNLAGKNIDRLVITVPSDIQYLFGPTLVDNIVLENAPPGTIIVEKVTDPTGGTNFGFTDTIATPNAFTLDDLGLKVFEEVESGTYTVTEDDLTPVYDLTFFEGLRIASYAGCRSRPSCTELPIVSTTTVRHRGGF
jgi:hypothetical protein